MQGFSDEQLLMLREVEQSATEREMQIIQIAKSVHELALLFQEMSILVAEQVAISFSFPFSLSLLFFYFERSRLPKSGFSFDNSKNVLLNFKFQTALYLKSN